MRSLLSPRRTLTLTLTLSVWPREEERGFHGVFTGRTGGTQDQVATISSQLQAVLLSCQKLQDKVTELYPPTANRTIAPADRKNASGLGTAPPIGLY